MSATLAHLLLLALAATLVWIAVNDIRFFDIPNRVNAGIALAAPLFWWASGTPLWPDVALQIGVAIAVFVVLAGAFYLGMMGGGDVKMAPAVLLWMPAGRAMDFMLIMCLAGGAVTLAALARHRAARREGRPEVPYGVAIAFAGLWLIAERYLYHFA